LGNQKENKRESVMKLVTLPVKDIRPNPFQPRESFEDESLKELAVSLVHASIVQPIIVRRHGKAYEIIAGERRWRSAKIAGLKQIPAIIKEVPDDRILLESLAENLHRKDLSDVERENAVHALWKSGRFASGAELARVLGITETRVNSDIEAKEFRDEVSVDRQISTETIRASRGLPLEERRQVIDRVSKGELGVRDVYTVAKILKTAPTPIKKELLEPKSRLTPRMAETILHRLPNENEQKVILEETKRFRLTEDEVEDRVREIQHASATGKPLGKEMGVQKGTTYTVGEYECTQCRKHYLIKCNGKQDWLE